MSSSAHTLPMHAANAASMTPAALRRRITSIDALRGLVMLIMLLDHVRETVYLHLQVSDPMNVLGTPPELFISRLAAHFCAPTFVFLAGLSAWLYAHPAGAAPRSARGFLFKRGLFIFVLELTLVSFAWTLQVPWVIYLQVMYAIGVSMMVLSLVHHWPPKVLAAIGLVLVCGHNALAGIQVSPDSAWYPIWTLLLHRGPLIDSGGLVVKLTYPVLPWIGVILLGYVAGPLFAARIDPDWRQRTLLKMGLACWLLLLILRGSNLYGENLPWQVQPTAIQTVMDFLNFTKYPPSLDFLLMALGGSLLVLSLFEHLDNGFTRMTSTFGGAPLFYCVGHLLFLQLLYHLLVAVFGTNVGSRFGFTAMWQVWLLTLALIPVLYVPCKAFAAFKRRSTQAWVRYL